jgi:hypothetical protein
MYTTSPPESIRERAYQAPFQHHSHMHVLETSRTLKSIKCEQLLDRQRRTPSLAAAPCLSSAATSSDLDAPHPQTDVRAAASIHQEPLYANVHLTGREIKHNSSGRDCPPKARSGTQLAPIRAVGSDVWCDIENR